MKQNIYLSVLLAAMLVIAGCGGGGSSTPEAATVVRGNIGTTTADLATAVGQLVDALSAAETGPPPPYNAINIR